ncbi:hypothetical protein Kpol_364p8 [Vanderwaltozyma polyspora DSM 70294]|uniref:Inosine/uridine-preferring nucleoside hydrolase domain-containing protein n=1 Tax=Vanderwaltozyma polyspora (strain ATCC 22028 / DSM 70294 / BCRC 21397 / CBS 2163 / NBRC 10782 / NRRL Y-8283 / UCD 57-17) TaxID=436907 RepID=A7TSC4_VANPO|nr:uncharacterized protein Kpol_364p8 [Vanderwaltozyma polyspora DSM 70294]EDO14836.1 hypothetical protein Kpol_364p8 [Vanderwaltozyma polyspora DSM 70294]
MTITKIPIWLDCDPGHDDAVALLLGCFHPAFKIYGISACYGNSSPEHTHYNARSLLTAFGKANDIPVYLGAQKPWVRKPIYAPDIHGDTGLDGTDLLPKPVGEINEKSYIEAVEEAVEDADGEITFISTGALTSIATILRERQHLKSKIKYISIMGGGFSVGNINNNKSAEFNIWVDPHAANFLFSDREIKDKCVLTPLDLTHKAIATNTVMETILGSNPSNLRRMYYELFQFFSNSYKNAQGFEKGPPVHDPITLIPLLELYGLESPSNIKYSYKRYDLDVIYDEKSDDLGKLIISHEYPDCGCTGVMVGFDLNIEYFWEQIYFVLNEAEKSSTIELIDSGKLSTSKIDELKNN